MAVVEDKVMQEAVIWILDAIYEKEFMGSGYGLLSWT
jgi:retron-type reverse transcriptase